MRQATSTPIRICADGKHLYEDTSNHHRMHTVDKRISFSIMALFLGVVIAVTLPNSKLFDPAPEDRRKEVISAFINATADPGKGGIYRTDWLVTNRQLRQVRQKRLAHVHPAVLAAFAKSLGIATDEFREILIDAARPDPFELAGTAFNVTEIFDRGESDTWSWVLMPEWIDMSQSEPAQRGECGVWLVFWTDKDWYYAPVGSPEFDAPLLSALPEFSSLFLDPLPACSQTRFER